jgi:flagellar hook-associated protein 1 FlgK
MSNVSLHIGLKALLTAQSALDTIGHNISNANTPGYSRQNLQVSAARPYQLRGLLIGDGVNADNVRRTVDDLLTRRIVSQVGSLQKLDANLLGMTEVEALLGEPGGFGIGGLIDNLFTSFAGLSSEPQDIVRRTGVIQSAGEIAAQFHSLSGNLKDVGQGAAERVDAAVKQVNTIARQIVVLNQEIAKIEGTGVVANDLRDQREQLLKEMAGEIDLTYTEASNGSVQVFVEGQLLVGSKQSHDLTRETDADGRTQLRIRGATAPVHAKGGRIGGLLSIAESFVPELVSKFNRLARNLILETNRAHSTGIPGTGGFQRLSGYFAVQDSDGDGVATDELLSDAGLEFDIQEGELYVNIVSDTTGAVQTTRIDISPTRSTVGDLLASLNAIPGLSASLDSFGRFQIAADSGSRFDFGRRLDAQPDAIGSFGGAHASLGSAAAGPFSLNTGDTLTLQGAIGAYTVNFNPGDFVDMSNATAAEIAAVINADPQTAANGLVASAAGDRLFVQSVAEGSSASFDVVGGTALGALGWSAGITVNGHDTASEVAIRGPYTGGDNDRFTFRPTLDGAVGTTPGLQVEVRDSDGRVVALLDVGAGYLPGTELEVVDGIQVSFGFGQLSATDNDAFSVELIADSDSADILAALGINSFFNGIDAEDIALRPDMESDPTKLAASATGDPGDNGVLLDMIALQNVDVDGLGTSLGTFYGNVIGEVGFSVSSTANALEVEQFLVDNLNQRRESVSGVNVDEELVNMIEYEQAFGAAAQYIQVVNSLSETLLSIV